MPTAHSITLLHLYRAFEESDGERHARLLARALRNNIEDIGAAIRCHVLGDDWMDFAGATLTEYWKKRAGYLYVAVNPMTPNFYKVGKTQKVPERFTAAGLNNEAVIGKFLCVQEWPVYDRHFLEKEAHRSLSHLARHKEFFHGSWAAVCEPIQSALAADELKFVAQGFPITTTK